MPGRKSRFFDFAVLFLAGLGALFWKSAYGATYNFYFNNTEQGNNSTANPTVSVAPTGTPTPTQVSAPATTTTPTLMSPVPVTTPEDPDRFRTFRIGVAYLTTRFHDDPGTLYTTSSAGNYSYSWSNDASAPGLSLELFLNPEVSLMAQMSAGVIGVGSGGLTIAGLVNFYPAKFSFGSTHIELGFSGGVLARGYGPVLLTAGPRVNWHLSKSWDLAIGARYIFGSDNALYNGYSYTSGSSGGVSASTSSYGPSRGWTFDAGIQLKI